MYKIMKESSIVLNIFAGISFTLFSLAIYNFHNVLTFMVLTVLASLIGIVYCICDAIHEERSQLGCTRTLGYHPYPISSCKEHPFLDRHNY